MITKSTDIENISDWTLYGRVRSIYKWSWAVTYFEERPVEFDNDNKRIWLVKL